MVMECVEEIGAHNDACSAYAFGSCLLSSDPHDIDILYIYHVTDNFAPGRALAFRDLITRKVRSCLGLNTDVVILTFEEEAIMGFAENENAKHLWP